MTLFGGADINFRNVESGANKFSGMAQDGIYSSRFGVMGTEDLGGGLKAGFHFEGGLSSDVGSAAGLNFTRKSTIGVMGGFGEVRMGRDYTPLFTVAGLADPFGTNGVGSSYNLASGVTYEATAAQAAAAAARTSFATAQTATASSTVGAVPTASSVLAGITEADGNAVRANNSVAYYSPAFNGFSVAAMYSFGGENTATAKAMGTMTSVKLAYANGPVSFAVANQVTKGGQLAVKTAIDAAGTDDDVALQNATDDQKWTTTFIAGSYDLGVAKLSAGYKTDKQSFGAAEGGTFKSTILGVAAPMGALTLKASYVARKYESEKVGNQVAFGGIYDLSKRTSVYAAYSVLNNEEGYGLNVGSAAASDFSGLTSKGFEFGVKHSF